jgi:hypothetical protein
LQVTGVQPIGGARYVALQPVVVETRQPPAATAQEAGAAAQQAARLAEAETVVFPRRGASIDQRPDELKHSKAAAKYRENERVEGTLEQEHRRGADD